LRLSICLRILRTSLISFYVPFASAIIDRSEVSVHCVMLLTYSYRTTNENIPGGKAGRRIIRLGVSANVNLSAIGLPRALT